MYRFWLGSIWVSCLFVLGCQPKDVTSLHKNRPFTLSNYDTYITDLPFSRETYAALGLKSRSMLEVTTMDLPLAKGTLVRKDTFAKDGRLLLTKWNTTAATQDSIRYVYTPTGQIQKVVTYSEGDSTYTQYLYDETGLMTQVVQLLDDDMIAYDVYHNQYNQIIDLQLSDESPTHSNIREIYRLDNQGRHIKTVTLMDDVVMRTHEKKYDRKDRLKETRELASGRIMSTSEYLYGQNGLLQLRKDKTFLSDDKAEVRMFEFAHQYY